MNWKASKRKTINSKKKKKKFIEYTRKWRRSLAKRKSTKGF